MNIKLGLSIYLSSCFYVATATAALDSNEIKRNETFSSKNYQFFKQSNLCNQLPCQYLDKLWSFESKEKRSHLDYWFMLKKITFATELDPKKRLALIEGPLRKLYFGFEELETTQDFKSRLKTFGGVFNKVGQIRKKSQYEETHNLSYLEEITGPRELFEELIRLIQTGHEEALILDPKAKQKINTAYRRLYQMDSDMGRLLFKYKRLREEVRYAVPLLKLIGITQNALALEWISLFDTDNTEWAYLQKVLADYRAKNIKRSPAQTKEVKLVKEADLTQAQRQTFALYSQLIQKLSTPEEILQQFKKI